MNWHQKHKYPWIKWGRIGFLPFLAESSRSTPKWERFSVVRISNYIVKIHCRLFKGSCSSTGLRSQIKNRKHRSWAARMREKAMRYFNSHYLNAPFGASSSPLRSSWSYPVLGVSPASPAQRPRHHYMKQNHIPSYLQKCRWFHLTHPRYN